MADISYLDAWALWLDGRSTLGDDLFGLPMIWWGRGGKIAAFAGGLTVLLDLLGPERLRYGPRLARKIMIGIGAVTMFALVLWLAIIVLAVMGVIALLLWGLVYRKLRDGFHRLLDWYPRFTAEALESWSRWTCFALVVIGFHFDLLAS
ncbi:hypothetical protein [Sphaerisporangium perillae]|uniref:hypothetical protein n=1 Tax=Sphaerisporangium perillae TaxID=2935860 RepID=UPI0020104781|nr:hypothetical protein [Sphaerisporangium perillae]